ncbi:MAG: carbon dioxide-concentrating mechanism protein CcmK [Pseudanabaenaceae cyanobacterium]
MALAVGVIETQGFPAVLAAADAMLKAGRVTLVSFEMAESARFFVAVRGIVAEVKRAMAAGIEAGNNSHGGQVITYYIIPNPTDNVVEVLPINFSDKVQAFIEN